MEPDRPLIQIDDLVRPMTDDEHAAHLARLAEHPEMPGPAGE